MGALKELLAVFTFKVDDAPLKKADKGLENFAKKVVTAFAASEIIGGIKSFVTETLAAGDAITDTAAALGVSRESLQAWQYAGGQVGVSAEGIATSMKFLQKNAVDGSAAFKKIGVDVKDASGNIAPVEDLMFGVAKGLSEVKDPALRTKLALELLGKGGAQMNALFDGGADGIDEMMKRFKELGGGFSEDMLNKMDAAGDAISDVELATKGLKGAIVTALAPSIKKGADELSKLVVQFRNGVETSTHLKAALITLGVVGAAAGVTLLAPYIPFLIALAAIYLAIDDIYTFFQGGDSGTGRLVEYLFGKGSAAQLRADMKGLSSDWDKFRKETEQQQGKWSPGAAIEQGLGDAGAAIITWIVDQTQQFGDAFESVGEQIVGFLADSGMQAGQAILNGITTYLNPFTLVGKATALGARIVDAIYNAIIAGAGKIGEALAAPFALPVKLALPGGGDAPPEGGGLGQILRAGASFAPGPIGFLGSLLGSNTPTNQNIQRHNNVRIDVHGANDPSELARRLQPIVHGAVNDDVDGLEQDLAGVA